MESPVKPGRFSDLFLITLAMVVFVFLGDETKAKAFDSLKQHWYVGAILAAYILSGFLGYEKYNQKRTAKAEKKHQKKLEGWEIGQQTKGKSDDKLRTKHEAYEKQLVVWKEQSLQYERDKLNWEIEKKSIEAQRAALWDHLLVCLRCAEVYESEAKVSS